MVLLWVFKFFQNIPVFGLAESVNTFLNSSFSPEAVRLLNSRIAATDMICLLLANSLQSLVNIFPFPIK